MRKIRAARGFILEEAIMVLMLIAFFVFPLIHSLSTGLISSEETKSTNTAVFLAKKKIEEVKMLGFDNITSETMRTVEGWPAFRRTVEVTSINANLRNIRVRIFFKTGGGYTGYVTIETLTAR